MVLIRYGDEKKTKKVGIRTESMDYKEDTVWSKERDARLRTEQLKNAGYYTLTNIKKFTNAEDEFVVWRSESPRRGTANYKKNEKRRIKREKEEI